MSDVSQLSLPSAVRRIAACVALTVGTLSVALVAKAQDTPLISGGVGFFSSTSGGNTTYLPVLSPLLAAPIGSHVLVESRANLFEVFFPRAMDSPAIPARRF